MRGNFYRSGLTLTELIVAMSVLGAFFVLGLSSIVPAIRITQESEQSLSSQREIVLAFDRLLAEMSLLSRSSVTVAPGALSFLSNKAYTGSNPTLHPKHWDDTLVETPGKTWSKSVLLRLREGQLWRREAPYDFGESIFRIKPDELVGLADIPDAQEKIFTRNVELFEAINAGHSRVLLKIRSVFRDGPKPVASQMEFQVQMRGGGL